MHTPTPFSAKRYETDEYPPHDKLDVRLIGSDGLCYGILFGGICSPYQEKCADAQALIVNAVNSYAAMKATLEKLSRCAPSNEGLGGHAPLSAFIALAHEARAVLSKEGI